MNSMGNPNQWLKSKQKDKTGIHRDKGNEKHVKFETDKYVYEKNSKESQKKIHYPE